MRDEPTAASLLALLLDCVEDITTATPLVHEDVRLHRLDGVTLRGRDEVLSALGDRSSGLALRVRHASEDGTTLHVALEAKAMSGWFAITLRGVVSRGTLIEIHMDNDT